MEANEMEPWARDERGEALHESSYGAADISVAAARVRKRDLVASLADAIKLKQGGVP